MEGGTGHDALDIRPGDGGEGGGLGEGALPIDLSPSSFVSTESADLAIFLLTLAMTGSPTGGGVSWEEHVGNNCGARAALSRGPAVGREA